MLTVECRRRLDRSPSARVRDRKMRIHRQNGRGTAAALIVVLANRNDCRRSQIDLNPLNFAVAAFCNRCANCGMFKTLTRRASNAFRRPLRADGAPPRLHGALDQILNDPLPDPDRGMGHSDPLPNPGVAASLTLSSYPRNEIAAVCERCGKVSYFRTHRLIAEYGPKEKVSDVLALRAEPCPAEEDAFCHLLPMTEAA